MLAFAGSKINIGLTIGEARPDGYHPIETLMYPLSLSDAVEFIVSSSESLTVSGLSIDEDPGLNLCFKAYRLLKSEYNLPPVAMCLLKKIPIGAGLGGGSSDAACMLKSMNTFFSLGIRQARLKEYATALGSDCAFFIDNVPALASGRGEILEPRPFILKGYVALLIHPPFAVSTGDAYRRFDEMQVASLNRAPAPPLSESIQLPVEQWKDTIENGFERVIGSQFPLIFEIKKSLYEIGAIYASMTGSGSAMYGIFNQRDAARLRNMSHVVAFKDCERYLLALDDMDDSHWHREID